MTKAQKWSVWEVHQANSRKVTDPSQPGDSTKPMRKYVVIADQANRDVTLCPVTDRGNMLRITEVNLPLNEYGHFLTKDSKVCAQSIYTVPDICLVKQIGRINHQEQHQITNAIIGYLGL